MAQPPRRAYGAAAVVIEILFPCPASCAHARSVRLHDDPTGELVVVVIHDCRPVLEADRRASILPERPRPPSTMLAYGPRIL